MSGSNHQWTQAQEDAFTAAEQLIREHFEGGVIVVVGECDEDGADVIRSTWHGGYAQAVGLLEMGKMKIWNNQIQGEQS